MLSKTKHRCGTSSMYRSFSYKNWVFHGFLHPPGWWYNSVVYREAFAKWPRQVGFQQGSGREIHGAIDQLWMGVRVLRMSLGWPNWIWQNLGGICIYHIWYIYYIHIYYINLYYVYTPGWESMALPTTTDGAYRWRLVDFLEIPPRGCFEGTVTRPFWGVRMG